MVALSFFFWLLNIPLLMSSFTHFKCFWRMKLNEDKHGDVVTGCIFFLSAVPSTVEEEHFSFALDVK